MIAANPAAWEHTHSECPFCEKQVEQLRALEAKLQRLADEGLTLPEQNARAEKAEAERDSVYDDNQILRAERDTLKARVAELEFLLGPEILAAHDHKEASRDPDAHEDDCSA